MISITSIKDKEEFKINFPIIKTTNLQTVSQDQSVNKEQKLNFNGWRNPLIGTCQVRRFGYSSLPLKANAVTYNEKICKRPRVLHQDLIEQVIGLVGCIKDLILKLIMGLMFIQCV